MLFTALFLGLLGSFHCLGMCGPIAFVLPLSRDNRVKSIAQTLLYHFGRLLSYTSIGLLFGLLGKGLYIAGMQQNLSVLIGILMILIVIMPNSILQKIKITRPIYAFVSKIKMSLGLYLNKSSLKAFFLIGILNGFLPCGLVYMALFGAISTGSGFNGALYMMFFGLGTIPMMTAALIFGNFLKVSLRNKIQKAIPIFVIIIGVLFILRGLGLGIPYISPPQKKLKISSKPMNMHHSSNILYLKKEFNGFSKR